MTTDEQAKELARRCAIAVTGCGSLDCVQEQDDVEKEILSTIPLADLLEVARAVKELEVLNYVCGCNVCKALQNLQQKGIML